MIAQKEKRVWSKCLFCHGSAMACLALRLLLRDGRQCEERKVQCGSLVQAVLNPVKIGNRDLQDRQYLPVVIRSSLL